LRFVDDRTLTFDTSLRFLDVVADARSQEELDADAARAAQLFANNCVAEARELYRTHASSNPVCVIILLPGLL